MMAFQDFLTSERVYNPAELRELLSTVMEDVPIVRKRKISYFNAPCAFDIETSSFSQNGEKTAIMYEWSLGINGAVIIGRTWDEFMQCYAQLVDYLCITTERRLVIYVHNMSFEFQFIRAHLDWSDVFAISDRKPITATTVDGVEFRCSYILSGYSLGKLGTMLRKYAVRKMTGDLDYKLIRHSTTPLTSTEIGYCVNDVKVVMAYVQETIETEGDIAHVPRTKTSYVRNYCRSECYGKGYQWTRYRDFIHGLTLTPDEYSQLKRAFQGGFTHANPFANGKVFEGVASYDFTSSYPAVMVAEQFPMSTAESVDITSIEELERNLRLYCCLFDLELYNLESQIYYDNYISESKCYRQHGVISNNGRVVSADYVATTVTEQDYFIIKRFYRWGKARISNFRRYRKDYLPTDFVRAILKLYQDKTTLKGVEGKEVEYLKGKEMLNSCYGMCVTDIVRDSPTYTDHWLTEEEKTPVDTAKVIDEYNTSRSRFLFYPWGVWVTAYARRNLFSGICACGNDYLYADTDSVKVINAGEHKGYFGRYNAWIRSRLLNAVKNHGLPPDCIEPKTVKGVKKCLGVWDYEGEYTRFKTLGAKRYMTDEEGKVSITVSGLNKHVCVPYLVDTYGGGVFDAFSDHLYIPPEFTGKNVHTYIDDPRHGVITDYLGNRAEYTELSGVHLGPSDYSLSISREYVDYILNINAVDY